MTLLAAPVLALALPIGGAPAVAEPAPARAAAEATVRVGSPHGVIAKGCHGHAYRYAVDVPAGESWALDLFLVDRKGRIASYAFETKGGDPRRGKGRFLFCSIDVRPGRYKLKAELTWSHYSEEYRVKARTKTVRLRRP